MTCELSGSYLMELGDCDQDMKSWSYDGVDSFFQRKL